MIKQIPRPEGLKSATEMSATELNSIHFSPKKTVLTPELLKKVRKTRPQAELLSNRSCYTVAFTFYLHH